MEKTVYVCLVEVIPLRGCELDPLECAGAIARCYVLAENAESATEEIIAALMRDRFEVVEFEWCVSYSDTDWENPTSPEAAALVAHAERTGHVVYGRFDSWGHDAPDGPN